MDFPTIARAAAPIALPPARVLVADDDAVGARALTAHLRHAGHVVVVVEDGRAAMAALQQDAFDLAVLSIGLPSPGGLEILRQIHHERGRPEVVIAAAAGADDTAAQALRLGAFAFLATPYRLAEVDAVVERAVERRLLLHENTRLRSRLGRVHPVPLFATANAALAAVLTLARRAAAGPEPIWIVGEDGTGKSTLAHELHEHSARRRGPLVVVDRTRAAADEIGIQLFGHVARDGGASSAGLLGVAGSVYIPDLAALPMTVQAQLARALNVGDYRSEGSATFRPVRARIIAASTIDAMESLHPDLVATLRGVRIDLPRLRDRPEDIGPLATWFVEQLAGGVHHLGADAIAVLQAHPWPGNLAELRSTLTRAVAVARSAEIGADDLGLGTRRLMPLADVERQHILAVLEGTRWHQGEAAKVLQISAKTLYRKIREYGFRRPRRRKDR